MLCGRRCGGGVVIVVIVTPSRVRCDLHAQKEEVDPCRVSLAGCQLRMVKKRRGKWGQGEWCCIDFSPPCRRRRRCLPFLQRRVALVSSILLAFNSSRWIAYWRLTAFYWIAPSSCLSPLLQRRAQVLIVVIPPRHPPAATLHLLPPLLISPKCIIRQVVCLLLPILGALSRRWLAPFYSDELAVFIYLFALLRLHARLDWIFFLYFSPILFFFFFLFRRRLPRGLTPS